MRVIQSAGYTFSFYSAMTVANNSGELYDSAKKMAVGLIKLLTMVMGGPKASHSPHQPLSSHHPLRQHC